MQEDKKLDTTNSVTIDMDTLTEGDILPEVNEAALAAHADDEKARALESQETPVKTPKLKKDGTPKKSGRPRKTDASTVGGKKKEAVETQQEPTISSISAAVTISQMIELTSVKLISEEWTLSEVERAANVEAWRKTIDYYGGLCLTPVQELLFDHARIIITRSFQPKTLSKYQLFKAWARDKFSRMKWKKENAHADNRPDNVGENDIRDEKGAGPAKAGN